MLKSPALFEATRPASTPTFRHSSTKSAGQLPGQEKHGGYQRDQFDRADFSGMRQSFRNASELMCSAPNRRWSLDHSTNGVAANAGASPEPAADPTDVKRIKAAVGILRQPSSLRGLPNSPTKRRRVRQSGQNQEARIQSIKLAQRGSSTGRNT